MVNSFLAESVGSDGYAIKGPAAAALQAGAALIALAGDQIGFTSRPVMQLPAATPTPGQVLAWNGSSWEPSSISAATPGGTSGQLQFNNGGGFDGVTGSYVSGSDVTLAGNLSLASNKQIEFGSVGIVKQSANVLYLQSASGATFRDMAGTGYVSATAQAFVGQDYVQGMQRVLVGNSSGGRLLPITDGVRIMNWAQTADGALQAGNITSSGKYIGTGGAASGAFLGSSASLGLEVVSSTVLLWDGSTVYASINRSATKGISTTTDGAFAFGTSTTNANVFGADAMLVRNATGPAVQVQAAGGLNVMNLAGSAGTQVTASTINLSSTSTGITFTGINSARFDTPGSNIIRLFNASGGVQISCNAAPVELTSAGSTGLKVLHTGGATIENPVSPDTTPTLKLIWRGTQTAALLDAYIASNTTGNAITVSTDTTTPFAVSKLGAVTLTGASTTTSNPMLNVSQTWNNAAVAFTGIQENITLTAASASSKYLDLQKSGTSQFYVGRGAMRLAAEGYEATNYWNWTVDVNNPVTVTAGGNGHYWEDGNGRWYFRKQGQSSAIAMQSSTSGSTQNIDLDAVVRFSNTSNYANMMADLGLRVLKRDQTTLGTITAAKQELYPVATTDKGLIIKSVASYATNHLEIQNSAATALVTVASGGMVTVNPTSGAYGIDVQASGTTAAIRAYSNLGYDINGSSKVPLRLEGVNNGYSGQLRIYPSASQSEYWIFSNGAGPLMEMGTGYIYFNKDLLIGTNIKSVSGSSLVLRGANSAIHFETGGSPTLRGGVSNGGNFVFGAAPSTDNGVDKLQVTGSAVFSSTVTSAFQTLSADPTTTDISAGNQRMVKNSTSGTLKLWANDAGTMKSVTLT